MNPARTRFPRASAPPPYAGGFDGPADGWRRIAPQTGVAVELAPGDRLTLLDPCGEQVSDLYLVRSGDVEDVDARIEHDAHRERRRRRGGHWATAMNEAVTPAGSPLCGLARTIVPTIDGT